ncbi:MAG TPA: hypothetical protein VF832_02470 [Longimicrobiales bacterium]
MKGLSRAAAISALLLPLAGAPLAAQSWKADLGVNGGGSWYSPMLSANQINNTNGDVRFRAGWLVGAQAGFWFTPAIGIRANGTYTDRSLKQGNSFMGSDTELWHDVNLWSGTGDLLFRLKQPGASFTRFETLPYIALGAGAKWIAPAGSGNFVAADVTNGNATRNGLVIACGPNGFCGGPGTTFAGLGVNAPAGTVGFNTGTNATIAGLPGFFLPSQTRFMGLAGLGADVRLAPSVGLRLEAGDRIYKPLLYAVTPGTTVTGATVETTNGLTNVSKTVHEVYAQAGLHFLMGLASPPVVAVAPAPAPPPAPEPAPAPAPVMQTATVCTVNPTTGLTSTTVSINPATNDTTVMINGQNMALAQAYTSVPVASGATWYVQGQPLVIGSGRDALNYVSYGSARNIDMNDLTYVGTVNGLPVFANRSDVTNLTIPNPVVDISSNPTLITGLRNVQVVYVPLTAYGCNFQPLQIQQAVRKTRK